MGTQVTLVYKIATIGRTPAQLQPFVAAAPIPKDVLDAFGLRIISDNTTTANPIVRTIVLGFNPTMTAMVLTPTFTNTNRILSVPIDPTNPGLDYISPPIVTADNNARTKAVTGTKQSANPASDQRFDDPPLTQSDAILRAFMEVEQAALVAGGTGYSGTPVVHFFGGLPPANFNFAAGAVRYINVASGGFGYPSNSKVVIKGGGPGGVEPAVPATAVGTFNSVGILESVALTDMGRGYISVPEVAVVSGNGKPPRDPAKLFAVMAEGTPATATATVVATAITALTITDPGDGYVGVPDIVITDATGNGALFRAQMGVGRVDIINPGIGYLPTTTFTVTPLFQSLFPAASSQAQAAMFFRFLEETIGLAAITPVDSTSPLVA
jgi:hypothetical protein